MITIPRGINLSKFTQDAYQPSLKAVVENDGIPTARKKFLKQLLQVPYELAQELDKNFTANGGTLDSVQRDKLEGWNVHLNAYCCALSEQFALEKRINKKLKNKTKEYALKSKTHISRRMEERLVSIENSFFKLVAADPLWMFEPYVPEHFFVRCMTKDKDYFSRLGQALSSHHKKAFSPTPKGDQTTKILRALMEFAVVTYPILPPGKTTLLMYARNEISNNGKLTILIRKHPKINLDFYVDAKLIKTIRERCQHKFADNPYWNVIDEHKNSLKETAILNDFLAEAFKDTPPIPAKKIFSLIPNSLK